MKRLYIILIVTVILALVTCFMVENVGYHRIQVEGGTLYGRITGGNKDVVVLIVAGSGPGLSFA